MTRRPLSVLILAAAGIIGWRWWRWLVARDEQLLRRHRAAYLAGAPWPAPTGPRDRQWRERWR